jgi:hypothetical protein
MICANTSSRGPSGCKGTVPRVILPPRYRSFPKSAVPHESRSDVFRTAPTQLDPNMGLPAAMYFQGSGECSRYWHLISPAVVQQPPAAFGTVAAPLLEEEEDFLRNAAVTQMPYPLGVHAAVTMTGLPARAPNHDRRLRRCANRRRDRCPRRANRIVCNETRRRPADRDPRRDRPRVRRGHRHRSRL